MTEAWIIDARRAPRGIGKARKGPPSAIHPQQLRAIAERSRLGAARVDDIVWGASNQRETRSHGLGRMALSTRVCAAYPCGRGGPVGSDACVTPAPDFVDAAASGVLELSA